MGRNSKGGRVTQVGEGQEAGGGAPPVMTFGAPAAGEILAERYELTQHINDDSAGRMVWRGVDVVLRRPVAVVLRYPGGDSAAEMLQGAVAASRVIHPNLVGVYDAIAEEERAYIVREWVDGISLRELVTDEPLDPARATSIGYSVASALAAIHASGIAHGNVHPGTVLIGNDGRVVLADARADASATPEADVRAVGGLLYFAMTGHWPHEETVDDVTQRRRSTLPDAVRDASRAIAAPRQMRAGVPSYLDELTMNLLDETIQPPAADVLAADLGRLETPAEDQYLDQPGPLQFLSSEEGAPEPASATRRKVLASVTGLLAVGLAGLLLAVTVFANSGDSNEGPKGPEAQQGATATPGDTNTTPAGKPKKIALKADQVRVIDPDSKKRDELDGIAAVVDGDLNKGWTTDGYYNPQFSNAKSGMGILIDLKEARHLSSVQVVLSAPGATAELRIGSADASSDSAGDKQIVKTYTRIGEPYERHEGSTMTFSDFSPDKQYRYLFFWITELPQVSPGKYKIGVQEIIVEGH
ncbi:MAG TPA: protein kinase family protein [Micromonosporaceae bacterium]|nr:protein kinase family protein [Micromonosporaceae bacterium]